MSNKYYKGYGMYLMIIAVIIFMLIFLNNASNNARGMQLRDDDFYKYLEIGQIDEVVVQQSREVPTGVATVHIKDGTETGITKKYNVSNVENFRKELQQYPVNLTILDVESESIFLSLLPTLLIMIVVLFVFVFIMQQAQGGGGGSKVMSFGKSRAKMIIDDKKKVTFKNVAGLIEEKEELKEVVDFLKKPRKFVELGARIPKGVILVGPPGTGKTLLAKAVAGEAGVPFFSISGSDFVEMFVGVGASRVRDLFEQAKKNAPCIVFIDEIDAVGRKRGAGLGGGHDEREQTLNQLLVEMDGFGVNEGVIVMAATNRVDILDPALLRPGRFDRRVFVGRPDVKGREEILEVHAKGKPLSDEVDLKIVAQTTAGFTGADLENLLNEAAIYAARENKKFITMSDIQRSFVKIGIGTEKKSKIVSEKEKKITAYHEAGHAITRYLSSELDPVHSISIIPTGSGAGGYTMWRPEEDVMYVTKKKMIQTVITALGGRAAEELIFNDITTGAYSDIQTSTSMARNMVTKYGMSDVLGPIQFGDEKDEVFIGRDLAHTRNYGENIAGIIDQEIKRIIDTSYEEAKKMLQDNMEILHKTSELLIAKEKVTGDEFKRLFEGASIEDILSEAKNSEDNEKKVDASKEETPEQE